MTLTLAACALEVGEDPIVDAGEDRPQRDAIPEHRADAGPGARDGSFDEASITDIGIRFDAWSSADVDVDASTPPLDDASVPALDGGSDALASTDGPLAVSVRLHLCNRLNDPQDPFTLVNIDDAFRREFNKQVFRTCEVAKLVYGVDLATFSNGLINWNYDLWGCRENGATTFLTEDGVTGLTSTDAAKLIDIYLDAAKVVLGISPSEALEMRDALTQIARVAIVRESSEYNLYRCPVEAGLDAAAEAGPDAASDAARDTGLDAVEDTALDTALDTESDAGLDTESDTALDTESDATEPATEADTSDAELAE